MMVLIPVIFSDARLTNNVRTRDMILQQLPATMTENVDVIYKSVRRVSQVFFCSAMK